VKSASLATFTHMGPGRAGMVNGRFKDSQGNPKCYFHINPNS
jgi:plasmid stabilization system protein ParE